MRPSVSEARCSVNRSVVRRSIAHISEAGKQRKALLLEIGVECECMGDSESSHYHKTNTVDQTQTSPGAFI